MTRPFLLAGALALAFPAFAPALADPSNPAAVPVAPSLGMSNQPTRTRVPASAQPDAAVDPAERTPAPEPADDAAKAAAEQARADAARPKAARTVRRGEQTMAAPILATR